MSPLQISIALHYHYSPTDFRDGDFSAPAVKDALKYFLFYKMLEHDSKSIPQYKPTERLRAYIEKLCSIDLPQLRWVYDE